MYCSGVVLICFVTDLRCSGGDTKCGDGVGQMRFIGDVRWCHRVEILAFWVLIAVFRLI